ncbi:Protein MON2 homolog [Seminavis robusta]|uniref:Protein MON2 homolog n=1 Tax=Seminavis robusta TaxID=568900 RepID=A0A9N8DVI0_9STRA|nr:Protein MON2 homolog [Seminavis robusta]|eukprot:Sro388_g132440.1 Protein MON2 homolog (1960) ;mRNA; r:59574-66082
MNFVAQLEDYLRDLGAEARKKHPGVKEASERAILRLRTLQNAYVSAVRKASSEGTEHPTTSLFQSQDLLHPFLLAANYPNASTKLLDISFGAMRLLMDSDAICPGDGIHMIRVWTIQAHVVMSQYQKQNHKTNKKGSDNNHNNSSQKDSASSKSYPVTAIASTAASWLGVGSFIGGGSSNSNNNNGSSNNTTSSTTDSKPLKNAVSSSSGHAGGQYNAPSTKDMEKIALEILSCLLKLTELLKSESLSVDVWTQSVSLCCLLLDFRKTVQQAARSTLPQIINMLYETSNTSKKYNIATWEDLLHLASYVPAKKKAPALHGAFSQCRLDTSSSKAPPPPPPEFALELMATCLQEHPTLLAKNDKLLGKTMGVTVALLLQATTNTSDNNNNNLAKTLRVFQWTLVVLQTQSDATMECRELLMHVIKPIHTACEVCRSKNDFDDGFVYLDENSSTTSASSTTLAGSNHPQPRSSRRLAATEGYNQETKTHSCLLPNAVMWKAGLAVETVYHVLLQSSARTPCTRAKALSQVLDRDTIVVLTESLNEFSTIGAACQSHILQLVDVCRNNGNNNNTNSAGGEKIAKNDLLLRSISRDDDHKTPTEIDAMLYIRAEQLVKSGASLFDDSNNVNNRSSGDKKQSAASSSSSPTSPHDVLVMGETLWIAFHGILEIVCSVLPSTAPDILESYSEGLFEPCLETLQHFVKRCPGSRDVTRLALNGYAHLSNLCMPSTTPGRSFKRKALLTSLCKMALPAWGKHDSSSQLRNHHVRALICLLRIVHSHYDDILSEWDMVLLTFEELSVMTIASPFLSDQLYHAALAISAVYGRFASFSTCFSDESLREFIDALATVSSSATQKRNLDMTNGNTVLDRVLVTSELPKPGEKSSEEGKESSIGGKLVNLGVRAIYGAQSSGETSEHNGVDEMPIAKRTKSSYYEAYRNDYVRRLEATTTASLRPDHVAMLPFGMALLADVAMTNSFRYEVCIAPISKHLCSFASVCPTIRVSVMDTVAMLILAEAATEENPLSFSSPAKVVFADPKQHQLLAVEPSKSTERAVQNENVSQAILFGPICECIQTVESAVVAEAAITVLTSILENVGHTLKGGVWDVIASAVASLSGATTERKGADWSSCCMLGFRCLKLIVDDFLDLFPPPSESGADARSSLLDCCWSYARSRHDVNTSLTAIGLLWTIADKDGGADAVDRALSKLVALASDSRPEVRNCSVNTLFSCIVGRGKGFTATRWQSCINDTVFGVYDLVVEKASDSGDGKVDLDGNSIEKRKSRYKVNVHHSRDSAGKQWIATQVLTLQGLSRVLRTFFSQILDHLENEASTGTESDSDDADGSSYEEEETDEELSGSVEESTEESEGGEKRNDLWLVKAWSKILECALEAAVQEGGRENLDLRYAGVELLVLCGQLSCRDGIQAALTPAKVGAKMQVIDGALREMDESPSAQDAGKDSFKRTHSKVVDECREALFASALNQMESYREFIETSEKRKNASAMEATQVQVMQKFIACLGSLYECCKDDELSQKGDLGDKQALIKYFVKPSEAPEAHPESIFVGMLTTVLRSASGGPRFLSPAQRSAIDLLRTMIRYGSSEALLSAVEVAGSWLFFRKDEDKASSANEQSAANLISCELASVVADELPGEAVSDTCKALSLWLALSQFPVDVIKSDRKSEGRRKAYYKHFLPVLREGLQGSIKMNFREALKETTTSDQSAEWKLVDDIWRKLRQTLVYMLSPIPDATDLLKISRAQEVLEVVGLSIEFVPSDSVGDLCAALSEGAAEALKVEQANRTKGEEMNEGELHRKRVKYREDALLVFKTCYSGMCRKKSDDPALLAITDKAFTDAIATVKQSDGGDTKKDDVSVDTFLMVCKAFQENVGLESLIVSSFPLLCQLVQTNNEQVRNAAAAALGSADLRQVLSDSRTRYEKAEERATRAEKEVAELNLAVAELQRKNDMLQQRMA